MLVERPLKQRILETDDVNEVGTCLMHMADHLSPNKGKLVRHMVNGTGAVGEELYFQRKWLVSVYRELAEKELRRFFPVDCSVAAPFVDRVIRHTPAPQITQYIRRVSAIDDVPERWERGEYASGSEMRMLLHLYLDLRCRAFEKIFSVGGTDLQSRLAFESSMEFIWRNRGRFTDVEWAWVESIFFTTGTYSAFIDCDLDVMTEFYQPEWYKRWIVGFSVNLKMKDFDAAIADWVAGRPMNHWAKVWPSSFGVGRVVGVNDCKHANDGNFPGRCGLPYSDRPFFHT
jgi:hypothetical protein